MSSGPARSRGGWRAAVLGRGQQVDAIVGRAQREHGLQRGARAASSPPRSQKGAASTTSSVGLEILDLVQLVVERSHRMQPGDGEPRQLRGDAGAPGVGAVGGEERHAGAAAPSPGRMNTACIRPIRSEAPA